MTVIAASGDIGAVGEPCTVIKGLTGGAFPPVKEVNLPAADPLVLATGGTSLNASHATGAYISETAWGLPFGSPGTQFQASGGGFSRRFARPAYQNGVARHRRHARRAGRIRRRLTAHRHGTGHQQGRQPIHHPQQRRHQRQRTTLGRPDRPGRPVRRPSPRVRQPRDLPHSAAAPPTTRRSTTSPPVTTHRHSPATRSTATQQHPAGTPSPAGAAPTHRRSSPCSSAIPTTENHPPSTTEQPALHRLREAAKMQTIQALRTELGLRSTHPATTCQAAGSGDREPRAARRGLRHLLARQSDRRVAGELHGRSIQVLQAACATTGCRASRTRR